MGQKFRDDKIGTLSHSAGVITMAASPSVPAWLTVGGQQYRVTANMTINVGVVAATTLYFIYAYVVGVNSLGLTTSIQPPSAGGAAIGVGSAPYKLIGAFYSNSLAVPTFGAFVTIDGPPETEYFLAGLVPITGSGGNPTKPSLGNIVVDQMWMARQGDKVHLRYQYEHNAPGVNGVNTVAIGLPTNITIDTTKQVFGSVNSVTRAANSGILSTNADGRNVALLHNQTTNFVLHWSNAGSNTFITFTSHSFANTAWFFSGTVTFAIAGWDTRSLKDL